MFDTDTLIQIKREEQGQLREQRKTILSKKISPVKKQKQWNELLFPQYETDDSYLLTNSGVY